MRLKEYKVVKTKHNYSKLSNKNALAIVATTYMTACSGARKGINLDVYNDKYIIAESFQEASNMLIDHTYDAESSVERIENIRRPEPKVLETTVVNNVDDNGVEDVEDIYFDVVLIVDKDRKLTVINTKEDGDWRDYVDTSTLVVKHVKLHI